jgi:hypothetical protein
MVVQPEPRDLIRRYPDVLKIHRLSSTSAARLAPAKWVLVRPDGYIASSGTSSQLARAGEFLDRWVGDQLSAARSTL